MKKLISIFLAGSKSLTEERNAIKASVHELNLEYKDKGVDVQIETESYENHRRFPDDQSSYDRYIEAEADVFVCILKDRIGNQTNRELATAVKAYNEKNIPEIIVFLNKNRDENSPEVAEIYKILREHFGPSFYYVEYSDSEDLKIKVKSRIERFVLPVYKKSIVAKKHILSTLFALTLLFSGLFIWSYFFNAHLSENGTPALNSESQSILFAGGGTMKNFLSDQGIDINNYPNAIYVNMASETAWPLIAEEYNRYMSTNNELRFVSIILSADRADKKKMLKSCKEDIFKEKACIVECYLGVDSMKMYISNDILRDEQYGIKKSQKTIKVKELKELLKHAKGIEKNTEDTNNIFFYSTSEGSGTRSAYNKSLFGDTTKMDINELCNNRINIFNEQDPNISFSKPYIIMGSSYYYSKWIDEKEYTSFDFTKDNGEYITKHLYLYFVAFKEDIRSRYYKIPQRIFEFLNKIDITRQAINNNNDYKKQNINASELIVHLTKRED